jgi:tripartite-type tricarboxylate transporter receptor subunit TctC
MIQEFRKKMYYGRICVVVAFGLLIGIGFFAPKCSWSAEENFPNKPIKILIPYEAGALSDIPTRIMIDYLSKEFKVPIMVENKGGGAAMIGSMTVLKAKPDGYTILSSGDSPMVLGPLQVLDPPYDALKDFLPLGTYAVAPAAYVVYKSSRFKSIGDIIKAAKENPGKVTTAITTLGGDNHLTFEVFRRDAAVNISMVPFKGTGEAVASLLGEHVDAMINSYVSFTPYIKSGEVRALATTTKIPGSAIPSFEEEGYLKTTPTRYQGFFVSSKTPKPIYEKLVSVFKKVATNPEVTKKFSTYGIIPTYRTPSEYIASMEEKLIANTKILGELGLLKKR